MRAPAGPIALVAAASVLATLPVWMPPFPAMTDLPQHAAQIALVRELLHQGFPYASLFEINWFTPYLLGYVLVYPLSALTGVVIACKIVVAVALAAVPVATALLIAETRGEPRWALLTIPAMYGFNYQWGFLNFLVAAPAGLLFLVLVFRVAARPTRGGAVLLAAGVNLLFFCHAMVCIACGLAAGFILLRGAANLRSAVRRCLPLASVLVIMALWGLRTMQHPDTERPVDWDLGWWRAHQDYYASTAAWAHASGLGWGRVAGIFPYAFGMRPGAPVYLAGAFVLALPLLAGARPRRDRTSWVPLATLGAIILLVPSAVFGTDFLYQRFALYVLPFYFVMLGRSTRPVPRWAWIASVAFITTAMAAVVVRTVEYEHEASGFDQVLAGMEPGERALSFSFDRDSSVAIAPTFLHFPVWYSALGAGVVDPSFAVHHVELVRYAPDEEAGRLLWGFEFNPDGFDWDYFEGWRFRYFVARSISDPFPRVFMYLPCPPRLRVHVNAWWLYENDPACRD